MKCPVTEANTYKKTLAERRLRQKFTMLSLLQVGVLVTVSVCAEDAFVPGDLWVFGNRENNLDFYMV